VYNGFLRRSHAVRGFNAFTVSDYPACCECGSTSNNGEFGCMSSKLDSCERAFRRCFKCGIQRIPCSAGNTGYFLGAGTLLEPGHPLRTALEKGK
jgi:hypothetical protein